MNCTRCGFSSGFNGGYSCPSCGGIISSEPVKPVIKVPVTVLWESIYARNNPFTAFFMTLKELFSKPSTFFARMPLVNTLPSWLFALIAGSLGYTFSFLWSNYLPGLSDIYDEAETLFALEESSSASTLLYTPILITLQILLITIYTHFALFVSRARNIPSKGTFKIVAYSQAAMILNIIPGIGSFCSTVYMLYLILTGIQVKNGTGKLKTFFLFFLPLILLLSILFIAVLFLIIGGLITSEMLNTSPPLFNR